LLQWVEIARCLRTHPTCYVNLSKQFCYYTIEKLKLSQYQKVEILQKFEYTHSYRQLSLFLIGSKNQNNLLFVPENILIPCWTFVPMDYSKQLVTFLFRDHRKNLENVSMANFYERFLLEFDKKSIRHHHPFIKIGSHSDIHLFLFLSHRHF
jgi:hypothetical protein